MISIKLRSLILYVLLFLPITLMAQNSTLDQLKDKFASGIIYHADFTHTFKDSYTGREETRKGTLWIGGNEYKIVAEDQTIIVNNGLSKVYDENRNRLIISRYDPREDDFAPSKFLTGTDSLYRVASQEKINDSIHITLKSDDPFSVFRNIEITLKKSLLPIRIEAVDQADNKVISTFSNGKFLRNPTDILNISYPDDAKIIDMREER